MRSAGPPAACDKASAIKCEYRSLYRQLFTWAASNANQSICILSQIELTAAHGRSTMVAAPQLEMLLIFDDHLRTDGGLQPYMEMDGISGRWWGRSGGEGSNCAKINED